MFCFEIDHSQFTLERGRTRYDTDIQSRIVQLSSRRLKEINQNEDVRAARMK